MLRNLVVVVCSFLSLQLAAAEDQNLRDSLERLAGKKLSRDRDPATMVSFTVLGPADLNDLSALAQLPALKAVVMHTAVPVGGFSQLKQCKKLRALSIIDFGAFGDTTLPPATLREIATIEQLEELSIQSEVDANGLKSFGNLKNLRQLNLPRCDAADLDALAEVGLLFLTDRCWDKSLNPPQSPEDVFKMVWLDSEITENVRTACGKFKNLSSLRFENIAGDQALELLVQFPELRSLEVNSSKVTDRSLDSILKLKELRYLDLTRSSITAEGVARLAKLENLAALAPPRFDDAVLSAMSRANLIHLCATPGWSPEGVSRERQLQLGVIELSGESVSDIALFAFRGTKNLRTLKISNSNIGDAGLKFVANHPELERLELFNNRGVRGDFLGELGGFPKLTHLCLQGKSVDDRAADGLARLTSLQYLDLNQTSISSATLQKLQPLKNLTFLRPPTYRLRLTDDDFLAFAERKQLHVLSFMQHFDSPASDDKLRFVNLRATNATVKTIRLFQSSNVRHFVPPEGLTDEGLEIMASMRELRSLTLNEQAQVTDGGLQHFSGITKLNSLRLFRCNFSDSGLLHFRNNLGLEYIELRDVAVTNKSLEWIATLPKLRALNVSRTKITVEGLQQFAKNRPDCTIGESTSRPEWDW